MMDTRGRRICWSPASRKTRGAAVVVAAGLALALVSAPAPAVAADTSWLSAGDADTPAVPTLSEAVSSQPAAPASAQLGEPAFTTSLDAAGADPQAKGIERNTFAMAVPGTYAQTDARSILDKVNAARAARGVQPLVWDTSLEEVAMWRAGEIVVNFDHTRPDGRICFTAASDMSVSTGSAAGENILWSSGNANADFANAQWTASPGHYSNMVSPDFTSMGAASFNFNGRTFWVEFFGGTSGTGFNKAALDGAATVQMLALPKYLPAIFTDVNTSDWYVTENGARDFLYSLNNGFMKGYDGQHAFGPYDSVSRGQVATILYRMEGEPKASAPDFSDVDYGKYYGDAIRWARSAGVIKGMGDNSFAPDQPVSREAFAVMLYNYAAYKGLDMSSSSAASGMPDWGSVHDWAKKEVAWAVSNQIITGSKAADGSSWIMPEGTAQRCAAAKMFARFHRDVLN